MAYHDTQNPGIGGIDELTPAEESFLTSLAGLPFVDGDILYYNSGSLQRLAIGNIGDVLKVSASNLPYWVTSSGGGTWGSITGTLSNQTDLQTALNAKLTAPGGTSAQFIKGDGSLDSSTYANTTLSNLASVAINTSLISDTDSTDDLGSTTKAWANLYVDTIRSITGNALALTPIAGQNLNVNLSTTGDFAVNTNQLYVDTSTGNVGLGTASPISLLTVGSGTNTYPTTPAGTNAITFNGTSIVRTVMNDGTANWTQYLNSYYDSSSVTHKYITSSLANRFTSSLGTFGFYTASSGIAGNNITWINAMYIDSTGYVGIGTVTPTTKFMLRNGDSVISTAAGADNNYQIRDDDVTQPFTGIGGVYSTVTANTVFALAQVNGTAGGGVFGGFRSGSGTAVNIQGHIQTESTTLAPVVLDGYRSDGGTGRTSLTSSARLLEMRNGGTASVVVMSNGFTYLGGNVNPTAVLHLKAGTATASTAPLKFTSGTLLTAAEAGAVEFLTDKYYGTITTGAVRKEIALIDPSAGLTSGRVAFATTNGRLTDDADFTFATDTLTVTKAIASTTLTASGGMVHAYVAKTASYTLTNTDYLVNWTSGTVNATLPTAVGITGQIFELKNSGTGIITILTTSSQTIDGNASGILTLLQWDSLRVMSDGVNWIAI